MDPLSGDQGVSVVELQVSFGENATHLAADGLAREETVTEVTVTVTGPDMDDVTEALEVDLDNNTATGSVEVPKGDSRSFQVEGKDESGIIQFSGSATQDITKDSETVGIKVFWIPPDAVDVTVSNIGATSVDVTWTESQAEDFYLYRILISTSASLNADEDRLGDDIYDRTSTGVSISGLTANTRYYIAVLVVDTELWYSGSLDYGTQQSIVKDFTTAQEWVLTYDDGNFESALRGLQEGNQLLVLFACPSYPCYIRSIWLYLNDESGQDGNYRLVIFDSNRSGIFRTEDPLDTTPGETWVGWNPVWADREDGTIESDFYAGIEYARTSDNNWPFVGFDESSNSQRSYFVDSDGNWSLLDDYGFFGNLGIRAAVETGGEGMVATVGWPGEENVSHPAFGVVTLRPERLWSGL